MKKHCHHWETSCFDCPSCGGLFKYCMGRIHSKKNYDRYMCFSKEFCRDRDLHKKKNPVYYRMVRSNNIITFERC